MIATHIHDALAQVKKLQSLVLEKKNFDGYSGKSRICGAVFLIFPQPFTNPWPMGFVFFAGEMAGGLIFHKDKKGVIYD